MEQFEEKSENPNDSRDSQIGPLPTTTLNTQGDDLKQIASPQPEGRFSERITIVLTVAISVIVLGLFSFVYLSLEGGFGGFVHNHRPLPNFQEGKSAQNRALYKQEIEDLDQKLTSISQKQYKTSFYDYCERTQYNYKVHTKNLASCKRRYAKLYLTNEDTCTLLPVLKKMINAQNIYDKGCMGENTRNYNYVTSYSLGSDNVTITFMNRKTALDLREVGLESNLYTGKGWSGMKYFERNPGNYSRWHSMLQQEKYPTVLLLSSTRNYYNE